MAAYEIRITRAAAKQIDAIGAKTDRTRILSRIRGLAKNPRPPGVQKLSDDGRYRVRLGSYRILYTINDDVLTIVVVKVAHRSKAYRTR